MFHYWKHSVACVIYPTEVELVGVVPGSSLSAPVTCVPFLFEV